MHDKTDIGQFRVSSVDADRNATSYVCRLDWDQEHGHWRAYAPDGLEAFSIDREQAALQLFALMRAQERNPVDALKLPPEVPRTGIDPSTVMLFVVAAVCVAIFFYGLARVALLL
jgi:hypothetical protein